MFTKLVVVLVGLAAAVGLTACSTVPDMNATPSNRLSNVAAQSAPHAPLVVWYHDVAPKIGSLERSVSAAQHAVHRPQHVGLYAACRTIKSRAHAVQAARAAPDHVVRHAYEREMTHFVNAANACLANNLLSAGRHVDFAHYWSRVADNRVLNLLRHKTGRT